MLPTLADLGRQHGHQATLTARQLRREMRQRQRRAHGIDGKARSKMLGTQVGQALFGAAARALQHARGDHDQMPRPPVLDCLSALGNAVGRGKIKARLCVAAQAAHRGAARVGAQTSGNRTADRARGA
jgi:hypothetical protein